MDTKYTYYHAGPLFTLADLHTNTLLAQTIKTLSRNRYEPIVPQDLEQRETTPHAIRDSDIRALLSCDIALFTYDGAELDSGTVVEYMIAKFADIPTVILRSDFRKAGDQTGGGDPWNLMSSFWPRTKTVVVNSMLEYKLNLAAAVPSTAAAGEDTVDPQGGGSSSAKRAGEMVLASTAERVVAAMDEVVGIPARLPRELREHVYTWLALMPGFGDGNDTTNVSAMMELLKVKEAKGLFTK